MPLAISDILITDWSSVFVDFLSLSKPTVFLDTPRTYTKSGVSKVFDNKSITRVKNYENLKTQILYSMLFICSKNHPLMIQITHYPFSKTKKLKIPILLLKMKTFLFNNFVKYIN